MNRKYLYAVKGIGIGFFLWFFLTADRASVAGALTMASPTKLVLAFLLFPLIYGLKSLRWQKLAQTVGLQLSFWEAAEMYCAALFAGILTPGKVGEAIKIPLLKAHNLPVKQGILITIADRALDAVLLGFLAVCGLFVLRQLPLAPEFMFLCVALGIVLAWTQKRRLKQETHWNDLRTLLGTHTVQIVVLTVLNWCVYFLQLYWIAQALSLEIPLIEFISIMTIVGIVSLLPVAPAGLGTREATLLFFFAAYNIPAHKILAFSYTIFALTVAAAVSIGGYCWLKLPLHHS
ncbi:hypothetical protein COU76_02090 [Candidatus Peregrinibacteria bacterium CG10_big_fil_rev_8_21_14_0_10_49_10]|nr:MAG: hypothetical protein COU76_02090 [Candidatus Peregrinibacteria bacterium CG10_big_fil_rev_8_21_14_0_10_49_10]